MIVEGDASYYVCIWSVEAGSWVDLSLFSSSVPFRLFQYAVNSLLLPPTFLLHSILHKLRGVFEAEGVLRGAAVAAMAESTIAGAAGVSV